MSKSIKTEIVKMNVKRTMGGLEIYVKSPILHSYFKAHSGGERVSYWDSNFFLLSDFPSRENTYLRSRCFSSPQKKLFNDDFPNLGWLMGDRVDMGQTYRIDGVYAISTVKRYIERAREAIAYLYSDYIKDFEKEVIVTKSEVGENC